MKISYYKTNSDLLAKTFCSLAEKCYYSNMKTFVVTASDEYTKNLDLVLWTYSKKHFIPHATSADPSPEIQPVLISTELQLQNSPETLMTVNNSKDVIESCIKSNSSNKNDAIKKLIILEDEIAGIGIDKLEKLENTNKNMWQEFEKFEQTDKGTWQRL